MPKAKESRENPQPPKKPLTAFFIYSQEQRPQIKQQYNLSASETVKKLSEQWNSMSEGEKDVYEEKSKILKEKYEEEKKDYENKYGTIPKKEKKGKREVKEKKEKKPTVPSAYLRFAAKKREELKGVAFGESGKIIGQAWRDLPDEEKKVYQDEYERDKAAMLSKSGKHVVDDDVDEDDEDDE